MTTETRPVDTKLWTVAHKFGAAGGPSVHVLTETGEARAFQVATGLKGKPAECLEHLHALGGLANTTHAFGPRISLTDFGKRFDAVCVGHLKVRGFVRAHGSDGVQITDEGLDACRRALQERCRLLERVRVAHPLSPDVTA